jgi:hypothetical protein
VIFFIMGIELRYQLSGAMYATFFPLERLVARLRALHGGRRAAHLTAFSEARLLLLPRVGARDALPVEPTRRAGPARR